jgi:hypothetical protein
MNPDRVSGRLRLVEDLHRQWRSDDTSARSPSKRLRYLKAIADVQHVYLARRSSQGTADSVS